MSNNYRISEKAIEDLEQIWYYTFKQWSAKQADRYYKLIMDEIDYLSTDFESGRNMDHIKPGYRVSKVKSHLIIYRKGKDEILEVVRILHEMMDVPNLLK